MIGVYKDLEKELSVEETRFWINGKMLLNSLIIINLFGKYGHWIRVTIILSFTTNYYLSEKNEIVLIYIRFEWVKNSYNVMCLCENFLERDLAYSMYQRAHPGSGLPK